MGPESDASLSLPTAVATRADPSVSIIVRRVEETQQLPERRFGCDKLQQCDSSEQQNLPVCGYSTRAEPG